MVLSIFGVSMALASMGQPVRTALAQATTETFCVVADARVERDDPDRNIGGGVMLQVDSPNEDGLGEMQSYLKFDVTIPAGATITSATLTLWVRPTGTNGTQHNVHVYSVSNDWTESGITWNNKPALGMDVGMLPTIPAPNGTSFPVSASIAAAAFSGPGTYAFALAYPPGETHSDGIDFQSKEGASPGPCLDITYTEGDVDT
ncbi:MAG: DNRLRE domain-containing protein, partial [Rhodococcus sp.]|nr:DNRLRE domain-containing protein [Rhodococcus sp. (in: high G+C Gram-positive bacteria)]